MMKMLFMRRDESDVDYAGRLVKSRNDRRHSSLDAPRPVGGGAHGSRNPSSKVATASAAEGRPSTVAW